MLKNEFEERIGREISDRDYIVIDKVYSWHPEIGDTTGKDQIAAIYMSGGMSVIRNMEETADLMIELNNEERELKKELDKIRVRREKVVSGNMEYERCRKAVGNAFDKADSQTEFEKMVQTLTCAFPANLIEEVLKNSGYRR